MPTQIFGRKVGSSEEHELLQVGEGLQTGGAKVPLAKLVEIEMKNLLKCIKMYQGANIEGYALIEGDPVKHWFTPGVPFVVDGDLKTPAPVAVKTNPYLEGLELVKTNQGTSGQAALAKCILSLYNNQHAFSIGEVLGPLDSRYMAVVVAMVNEYAAHGETEELRKAGAYAYANFPRLVELSNAMSDARAAVRREWDRQHEAEMRRLYPDEYKD